MVTPDNMQCQRSHSGALELILDLLEFGGGCRHSHAGVVPGSGFLHPEGGVAVGRLAVRSRRLISGDIDGDKVFLAIPFVGLADLVGRLIMCEPPGATVSGPDGGNSGSVAIGVGTEPDRTVARIPQPLGGREELVQSRGLTECEPLGQHPLPHFDLAGKSGVGLGPCGIERGIIP